MLLFACLFEIYLLFTASKPVFLPYPRIRRRYWKRKTHNMRVNWIIQSLFSCACILRESPITCLLYAQVGRRRCFQEPGSYRTQKRDALHQRHYPQWLPPPLPQQIYEVNLPKISWRVAAEVMLSLVLLAHGLSVQQAEQRILDPTEPSYTAAALTGGGKILVGRVHYYTNIRSIFVCMAWTL